MKFRVLLHAVPAYLFLITLGGMGIQPLFTGPAVAEELATAYYDVSKFGPLPVPKNFPAFVVIDNNSSNEVFIGMKRNMVPQKYFFSAVKQTVEQASANIVETGSQVKFIIKELFVKPTKTMAPHLNKGKITATITVEVFINSTKGESDIGVYNSSFYNDIDNVQSIDPAELRYVLNRTTYKVLQKIFTDEFFTNSINSMF